MDQFSDPALKLKYRKCKFKVKQWESDFRDKWGVNPSKDDIRGAPSQIREAYKWYWQLKIHALGQDSLIDATFLDSYVLSKTIESCNSSGSANVDSSLNSEMPSAEVGPGPDQSTCFNDVSLSLSLEGGSRELNVERRITDTQSSDMTDRTRSSSELNFDPQNQAVQTEDYRCQDKSSLLDESSQPRSSNVWGPHLNNCSKKDKKSEKRSLIRSSSFQLSEKLFHGSRFRKRNPRKSLSFSGVKAISMNSIPSTESLSQISDSSCLLEDSQDDGFHVEEEVNDRHSNIASNLVVVKTQIMPTVQPIGAVQKLLENRVLNPKSKSEWNIDKGWIERVSAANQLPSDCKEVEIDKIPSICCSKNDLADVPLARLHCAGNVIDVTNCSDDDIIYDSDTECKETDQKSRLALLSNVIEVEENNTVISGACEVDGNQLSAEVPKKRKLDAVEAAIAVLSKEELASKVKSRSSKRSRKSSSSVVNNEPVTENGEEESKGMTTRSCKLKKAKLSKTEILEKRLSNGTVNDNFVRINMKKKVFVRGKKTMNFQKYKKQQWKRRKQEVACEASAAYASRLDPSDSAAGGLSKCFKCGDVGHFARNCLKFKADSLLPNDDVEVDESPFPSLAEVEKMAQERIAIIQGKSLQTSTALKSLFVNKSLKNPPVIEDSEPGSNDKEANDNNSTDHHVECDSILFTEPENTCRVNFEPVRPLYPLNEDGSMITTPEEVYQCLHMFGHQNFRPGQEEAIMRVLSGLSTLVTLSTGSGKSLCYQLPAYLFASHNNCITLVISPLVSLMDDQVTGLPSFIKAAALHTGQTEKQKEKVMDMVKSGKLQFLLVSPEAVVAGEKLTGFGRILRELPDIAFACIDEVHCVSQWSHNFRPSYLMLCKVLREKLGVKTILGLTATATHSTVKSIVELLNIPDGFRGVIQDVPLPNNLLLTVSRDCSRDQSLVHLLCSERFQAFDSIIIYCTRREECERLASLLRTRLKDSKVLSNSSKKERVSSNAEAYHAGLSAARRKQVQNAFMAGKLRIVVATVAFGMGINKANIRAVIHYNMPRSFESYVQEVGRAGRDGKESHCHLFLDDEGRDLRELQRHIFADSLDRHTIRKLLQRVFISCKCNKASLVSDDFKGDQATLMTPLEPNSAITPANDKMSSCMGHEVAFSIESTVQALDIPEENILTLLCYLELHEQHLIEVLPNTYTLCKVQSYRGMKHILHVAKSCPPLAMAVAMDLQSDNKNEKNGTLEFPVVEVADIIHWNAGIAKRELMNLEWMKVGGQSRRTGLKIELSDLGFHVKAPGNLPPEQMDAALDFMHQRVIEQEKSSLRQLQFIFNALTDVSYSDVNSMMKSSEKEKHSLDLKQKIRSYFQMDHLSVDTLPEEDCLENKDQIANDIRQLVNMYRDCSFTGRAVARIFHGISSPNFPSHVWGRCRFWRSHLDSNFKLICQLAAHVLLKMR